MIRDCRNIYICPLPNRRSWTATRVIQIISKILGFELVGLGSYGTNFFPQGVRFDHNFYQQAKIDFNSRWDSFFFVGDEKRENELFDLLGCSNEAYIFLHEDVTRNFIIDRQKILPALRIIQPLSISSGFSIFDYRKVIERATELHLIESSFAAFVESLDLEVQKYAHRYARGHAANDYRHEFTYRSNWTILK